MRVAMGARLGAGCDGEWGSARSVVGEGSARGTDLESLGQLGCLEEAQRGNLLDKVGDLGRDLLPLPS